MFNLRCWSLLFFSLFFSWSVIASTDHSLDNWGGTTGLSSPRSSLGVVIANNNIYAIGGYYQGTQSTVEYAPIQADGSVGSWKTTVALPVTLQDMAVVASGNYIYVLGGANSAGGTGTKQVYRAEVSADGTLSAWSSVSEMQGPRSQFSAVIHNDFIYVVGGYNGVSQGVTGAVEYVQIKANGDLGGWQSGPFLPHETSNSGLAVVDNTLFSVGGYTFSGASSRVHRIAIATDGHLQGSWTLDAALPVSTWAAGVAAYDSYIYLVGGALNGGTDGSSIVRNNSNQGLFAEVVNGAIAGGWQATSGLPAATAQLGVAMNGGYLYSVGGTQPHSSQKAIGGVNAAKVDIAPVVTSFSPPLQAHGGTITVTSADLNTAFAAANQVHFAGGQSAVGTAISGNSLTVTVPQGAQSGNLSLTVNGIQGAASSERLTVVDNLPSLATRLPTAQPNPYTITLNASFSDLGSTQVDKKGFCVGAQPNPTFSNQVVTVTKGTTDFQSNLLSVTMARGGTYYARACAKVSWGSVSKELYGNQVSFTNPSITVTTNDAADMTQTTANLGGAITPTGVGSKTQTAVEISGGDIAEGSSIGISLQMGVDAFSGIVAYGLSPSTSYNYRAKVTLYDKDNNLIGTFTGASETFSTTAVPAAPANYPYDGIGLKGDLKKLPEGTKMVCYNDGQSTNQCKFLHAPSGGISYWVLSPTNNDFSMTVAKYSSLKALPTQTWTFWGGRYNEGLTVDESNVTINIEGDPQGHTLKIPWSIIQSP